MFLARLLSTFFYVGYLPVVPGTFGSLCGAAILYYIGNNTPVYLFGTAAVLVCGFLSSGAVEKSLNKKDPGCVVIDEVAGMMISFMGIPLHLRWLLAAFLLFRLLDILKPYPANVIEKAGGSVGIMGDDIIAGIYTNIIMQFLVRVAGG